MIDWLIHHLPDPRKLLIFHLAHLLFWLAITIPAMLWWRESVPWVVFLSQWALVIGSISTVTSALAEIKADPDIPTGSSAPPASPAA